jgi:hypothetical protein
LAFRHDNFSLSARRRIARVVRLKSIEMARAVFPASIRARSRSSSSGAHGSFDRGVVIGSLEPTEGEQVCCAVRFSFIASPKIDCAGAIQPQHAVDGKGVIAPGAPLLLFFIFAFVGSYWRNSQAARIRQIGQPMNLNRKRAETIVTPARIDAPIL